MSDENTIIVVSHERFRELANARFSRKTGVSIEDVGEYVNTGDYWIEGPAKKSEHVAAIIAYVDDLIEEECPELEV